MNTVRVKKEELLKALQENREKHRDIFKEAQVNYRERLIEELDRRLEDVQRGRKVDLYFNFPEPEDHTKDYDRAIRMLEMSVEDELEISQHDFTRYVCDDWEWRRAWVQNTVSYTQGA